MIISVGHLDRPELPYVNTSSLGVINLPFLKTFTYFLKINAVRRLQSVKRYGRLKSYPIVLIIHSFCSVELTKSWNTWCLNSSGSEELECEHCAIPPEVNNLRSARSSNSSFLFLNTIEQSAGKGSPFYNVVPFIWAFWLALMHCLRNEILPSGLCAKICTAIVKKGGGRIFR